MANDKSDVTLRLRQNLAFLLKDNGMTASQLSRKTGVSKQVLSDWMAGVQPRRLDHLYKVAQTLGLSIDALCFAGSDAEISGQKATMSNGNVLGSQQGIPELRGRYEVYMRRIDDV